MKLSSAVLFIAVTGISSAQSGLWVNLSSSNSPTDTYVRTDSAVRDFARRTAALTKANRAKLVQSRAYDSRFPFTLPLTVHLAVNGRALAPVRRAPGPITLVFDTTGTRVFPADYRTQLQDAFNAAKGTMDIVFGQPASAGPVLVKNYDADIGDRDAVAGGYFLPNNGSGQKEIRFPVYTSPEAAAVNFVHCLLLAYIGPNPYGFDAFQEGIVRAAAMKVVRTNGALPATLDQGQVEAVLANTYDVGSYYDWYNQRALGGKQFIAPNLRSVPLPSGGSLGGIYLLRYQMAGSAWQKLVTENPGFLAEFNRRFYLTPAAGTNVAQLLAIGQAALDTVKGAANSKVEGLAFNDWFRRQYILETKDTLGLKLLVQPTPITSGLVGPDFGVFDVSATYFETQAGGNEVLLSGTSYPIFWDRAFDRVFPSAQEDTMPIAGAYGSVTPNLPDLYAGKPYRCTVDIPVGDKVARAYIPAGAIATAGQVTPNNFYGTVIGQPSGSTIRVRAIVGSTQVADALVSNSAFGVNIAAASFQGYARMRIDVMRIVGSTATLLFQRFVNKGPGEIALDLRIGGDGIYTFPGGLLKGIQMIGLPVDPFASTGGDLLGIPESEILMARYNPTRVAYDLYPNTGAMQIGNGFFVRMNSAGTFNIAGRAHPGTAVAIPCKPGWNLITCPLKETVLTSRIQVIKRFDFPVSYTDSIGVDVGAEFFRFVRGPNDAASGAPETGTMVAATSFEPGKAYYVRVLASEGVSLVFFPSTTPERPGTPFLQTGWRMNTSIRIGQATSVVVLGQSNTGNRAFDRKEDSPMAPRSGGFQVIVEAADPLYKDVRRLNSGETYKLRIEGLKAGVEYTLEFARGLGTAPPFVLYDAANGVFKTMQAPTIYRFYASGTTHRLEIRVNGGGQ